MTTKSDSIDLPGVNWLASVLGKFDFPGLEVPLGRDKGASLEHGVAFSDEHIKKLFLDLAAMYRRQEDELYRLRREIRSLPWHPGSEPPVEPPHSSRVSPLVLVTSPALHYVCSDGVAQGAYRKGWFICLDGKWIRHEVSHWRHLPASPEAAPPYADVQQEVERLRREAGWLEKR